MARGNWTPLASVGAPAPPDSMATARMLRFPLRDAMAWVTASVYQTSGVPFRELGNVVLLDEQGLCDQLYLPRPNVKSQFEPSAIDTHLPENSPAWQSALLCTYGADQTKVIRVNLSDEAVWSLIFGAANAGRRPA